MHIAKISNFFLSKCFALFIYKHKYYFFLKKCIVLLLLQAPHLTFDSWMDILRGKMPTAVPITEYVNVGEEVTMLIKIRHAGKSFTLFFNNYQEIYDSYM